LGAPRAGVVVIVGYVDHLGYLRCVPCFVAGMPRRGEHRAVRHDETPHNGERCDMCKRFVKEVKVQAP